MRPRPRSPFTRSLRRPGAVAVGATVLAGLAVALAPAAQAAPVYPSGWHLTAVSHSGMTVTVNRITTDHPTSYRVVASTDKTKLTASYLNAHSFRSTYTGASSSNAVPVRGMAYTTTPYYYRVGVTYARYSHYVAWGSTISGAFGLTPNPVTGVTAHGTYLSWSAPSGGSTGAAIDQTNATTGAKVTYTIHQTTTRFTPYGLTTGTRYSFRVRAMNQSTHSASSSSSAVLVGAPTVPLKVMSYNTLGASLVNDGNGHNYYGWADRVVKAGQLVAHYKPDVLTVEEGDTILGDTTGHPGNHAYPGTPGTSSAKWSTSWWSTPAARTIAAAKHAGCNWLKGQSATSVPYRGTAHYWPYRAVDSLCDYANVALKASVYRRAVDATPLHNGSGVYLVYNTQTTTQLTAAQLHTSAATCWGSDQAADTVPAGTSTSAVRCGGFWSVEDNTGTRQTSWERLAAWGVFQRKDSAGHLIGRPFLVVAAHTSPLAGSVWDSRRENQVKNMVVLANAKARALGISSIVYGGDFNTYPGRPVVPDVTTPVMRANGLPDSAENAQHNYNTQYMSYNTYSRTPKKQPGGVPGYSNLDHIYVTSGVGVSSFGIGLILSRGQFSGAIPSDHNPVWASLSLPA